MNTTLQLCGGRVIDPSQAMDQIVDLWTTPDGRIGGFGTPPQPATKIIDCTGMIVTPGLIDMHVHLREPGREEDETIKSGTRCAVMGGVTSVACMPNTEPAIDSRNAAEYVILQAKRADYCNVFPIGAVTKGREGKELAEIGKLVDGGAVAFTDDGAPVVSAEIMRRALEYCKMFDRAVLVHAEILELTVGGVMNEGEVSLRLGLRGMPGIAEDIMIYRDIVLAELTGGKVHILHVSTAGGVDLIRQGIKRGVRCSGEACPHHFILTDREITRFDSNYKMSPPLRTQRDVEAILEGLRDDTLSVLATDHAPHAPEKKAREFDQAPNGIIGLETFLPLCTTHLVKPGVLSWPKMIEKMTINPAKVLGIDRGTLQVGKIADITVIDPTIEWTYRVKDSASKSRNSPFDGTPITSRAMVTIVNGVVKLNRFEGVFPNTSDRPLI